MLATALNNANSVANNAQTIANQTADKFTWIVKSGTNSTNFTLTDRTAQLVSDEINLKGLVKFSGLTSSTQKSLSEGKCLFPDLTFSIGTNNIQKYYNGEKALDDIHKGLVVKDVNVELMMALHKSMFCLGALSQAYACLLYTSPSPRD